MFEIIVETYRNDGEPSSSGIRVRPVQGQGYDGWNVWCSKAAHEVYSVGALFRVVVTVVHRKGAKDQLRIGLGQEWRRVTPAAARRFIASNRAAD